jgi:cell division protein FtsZ
VSKRRASMREGPLADLFRQTDGSQESVAETPAEQTAAAAAAAPAKTPEAPVREPVAAESDPPERAERPQRPERPAKPSKPSKPADPDVGEDDPGEQPRLRAVPDPADVPEMPALPAALRARGEASASLASIRVVGVGGGGLNALQRMIDADLHGVEFVAVNTDAQQLAMSDATVKLQIGRELTSGLGSGSDPDLGRKAAEDSIDRLRQVLRGSDLVFVTAGEGGGTGTGAAPVIARVARELGALTVGIVTMPFGFEGRRRTESAQAGLEALQGGVDTLIVVPNDRLLEVLDRGVSMIDAFRMADDVLRQGVQGICDLITRPGVINLDFADVRTVMADSGSALMGIGMATGPARGREAARRALDSPLIGQRIRGATGVLLSIMGPPELTLQEVTEAAEAIREAAAGQANIIFGTSVDETLGDQLWVTVIATGFERQEMSRRSEPERSRDRSPLRELEIDDDLDVPSFLRD